jgi:hypothetical protein
MASVRISGGIRHPYVVVWVGALVLFAVVQLSDLEDKATFFVLIVALAMLISLGIKIDDWEYNLADEVYDGGDFLVVKSAFGGTTTLIGRHGKDRARIVYLT